jgi:uncharacterized protein
MTMSKHPPSAPRLCDALLRPGSYPHPAGQVDRLETHISWVFLAGPFAYKVKKPVRMGFVDFSTLEARRRCCDEEVRLNRRLAPDLYLDVVEIRGHGDTLHIGGRGPVREYAVRMRRFPQDALASRLLADGELLPAQVAALAVRIAAFHSGLPAAAPDSGYGTSESVRRHAMQNFEEIDPMLQEPGDRAAVQRIRDWTERELAARDADVQRRRASGMVRECHGDLHLGNVVLLDGELVPFDCIEFNADLRWNDVMSEVAFLMMDLMDRGAPHLAWLFLNAYLEETGDYSGLPLLRSYLAYRALVRAKVHLLRARQAPGPAEETRLAVAFRRYVALAQRCAHCGSPALLLMHGLSGCGKSTIAAALAQRLAAIRLRSDVERKRLRGMTALQRSGSGVGNDLYRGDATDATYARLAELAHSVVAAGHTAVVDATFLQRWQRARLRGIASALRAPIAVASVHAPESVLRQRVQARAADRTDASEATIAVLDRQMATSEPISPEEGLVVIELDGCAAVDDPIAAQVARALVNRRRSGRRAADRRSDGRRSRAARAATPASRRTPGRRRPSRAGAGSG